MYSGLFLKIEQAASVSTTERAIFSFILPGFGDAAALMAVLPVKVAWELMGCRTSTCTLFFHPSKNWIVRSPTTALYVRIKMIADATGAPEVLPYGYWRRYFWGVGGVEFVAKRIRVLMRSCLRRIWAKRDILQAVANHFNLSNVYRYRYTNNLCTVYTA